MLAAKQRNKTLCARCTHNIAGSLRYCAVCYRLFHPGCVSHYLKTKSAAACCAIHLGSPIVKQKYLSLLSATDASSLSAAARTSAFDNARDISSLSMELSGSDSTVITQTDLPSNWEDMTQSQQLAAVFRHQSATAASTNARLDAFTERCESQEKLINDLLKENTILRSEIDQLKELYARGSPCTQLKVTGVPSSCKLRTDDLATRIFNLLGLDNFCVDIIQTRSFARRPGAQSTPSQQRESSVNVENGSNTQQPNGSLRDATFSFVIRLKSAEVRKYILEVKRKFGNIKFSALVGGTNHCLIGLYELAPQPIHELRLLAKSRTQAINYDYAWLRDGNVYVRKDENSERQLIVTEADLDRLA